jgi:hypothetical protein
MANSEGQRANSEFAIGNSKGRERKKNYGSLIK